MDLKQKDTSIDEEIANQKITSVNPTVDVNNNLIIDIGLGNGTLVKGQVELPLGASPNWTTIWSGSSTELTINTDVTMSDLRAYDIVRFTIVHPFKYVSSSYDDGGVMMRNIAYFEVDPNVQLANIDVSGSQSGSSGNPKHHTAIWHLGSVAYASYKGINSSSSNNKTSSFSVISLEGYRFFNGKSSYSVYGKAPESIQLRGYRVVDGGMTSNNTGWTITKIEGRNN